MTQRDANRDAVVSARRPPSARGLVATIAAGTVLNPLDATMVAVALPAMQAHFQASIVVAAWVISGFFIAGAVGQTLMGRLADQFGARRVFRLGLIAVAASCLGAAMSPSIGWLLSWRVVQALGTSVAFPAGTSLIRRELAAGDGVPPARAIGAVTTVNSVSTAVGPFLGGVLTHFFGWQSIFLVNVPVALVAALLAGRWLPPDRTRALTWSTALARLDLPGAVLYSASLLALLGFLMSTTDRPSWFVAGLSGILLVLFLWRESTVAEPFVDVPMLVARPRIPVVFAQYALANVAHYLVLYALPQWLQTSRGTDAATAGLVVLPIAVCGAVVTPWAARWIQRAGPRPALLVSGMMLAVGGVVLLPLRPDTTLPVVALAVAVLGLVNNPNTLALQTVLYRDTPVEQTGAVSGTFQSFRYLGSTLSTVLLVATVQQGGDLRGVAVALIAISGLLSVSSVLVTRR